MVMFEAQRVLAEARGIQEAVMIDRCQIHRRVEGEFDPETGTAPETYELVYEGVCRVPREDSRLRAIAAGDTITPATPKVLIPWDSVDVKPDDRVTVTYSLTPGQENRVLWVTDTSPRTYQSAVHLTCREVR